MGDGGDVRPPQRAGELEVPACVHICLAQVVMPLIAVVPVDLDETVGGCGPFHVVGSDYRDAGGIHMGVLAVALGDALAVLVDGIGQNAHVNLTDDLHAGPLVVGNGVVFHDRVLAVLHQDTVAPVPQGRPGHAGADGVVGDVVALPADDVDAVAAVAHDDVAHFGRPVAQEDAHIVPVRVPEDDAFPVAPGLGAGDIQADDVAVDVVLLATLDEDARGRVAGDKVARAGGRAADLHVLAVLHFDAAGVGDGLVPQRVGADEVPLDEGAVRVEHQDARAAVAGNQVAGEGTFAAHPVAVAAVDEDARGAVTGIVVAVGADVAGFHHVVVALEHDAVAPEVDDDEPAQGTVVRLHHQAVHVARPAAVHHDHAHGPVGRADGRGAVDDHRVGDGGQGASDVNDRVGGEVEEDGIGAVGIRVRVGRVDGLPQGAMGVRARAVVHVVGGVDVEDGARLGGVGPLGQRRCGPDEQDGKQGKDRCQQDDRGERNRASHDVPPDFVPSSAGR